MSQYKHSFHTRIDTIGDRNVDQPVFTADGYRGFGPFFGQGVKTRAGAAAEDEANNFYHGASVVDIIRFEGCWFEGYFFFLFSGGAGLGLSGFLGGPACFVLAGTLF